MTKSVFSGQMTAHVWAQQSQESGRSGGNIRFEGDTLYSYAMPIARFVTPRAVLITSEAPSPTTHKHVSWARRGLPHDVDVFSVPNIADYSGYAADQCGRADGGHFGAYHEAEPGRSVAFGRLDHVSNLAHLVKVYRDSVDTARRTRDESHFVWRLREMHSNAVTALAYYRTFKDSVELELPGIDAAADSNAIHAARAAAALKRETPAYLAAQAKAAVKREAARKVREAQEAEERRLAWADSAERIAAWRNGAAISLRYGESRDSDQGALLRVRSNNLETSQGATVPLAHAVRVFKFVKLCRERGEGWQRNGSTLRVGHFQVDSVDAQGNFKAGCHLINWPEVETAARAAGVFGEAADDTRDAK